VGRFVTADPLLGDIMRPQSLNRYVYVENNPVNAVDPSGAVTLGELILAGLVILFVLLLIIGAIELAHWLRGIGRPHAVEEQAIPEP
jgi:hypothetical protein